MAGRDRGEIDRENASKSTGPRSAEGKAKSAVNAVRHGLTARTEVAETRAPGDPSETYMARLGRRVADLNPMDIVELTLAERACRAAWRLAKCDRYEDATAHKRERDAAEAFDRERGALATPLAAERQALVRAERARLARRKAKCLDVRARDDRAGAADRSLFDDARGASLLIRYTIAAGRDLHRSLRDLARLREASRPDDGPRADPDGAPGEGPVRAETGRGTQRAPGRSRIPRPRRPLRGPARRGSKTFHAEMGRATPRARRRARIPPPPPLRLLRIPARNVLSIFCETKPDSPRTIRLK